MRSVYDLMNMDLQQLTDTNHEIASTYMAILTKIIDKCKGDKAKLSKVKIKPIQVDGDQITVSIKYG